MFIFSSRQPLVSQPQHDDPFGGSVSHQFPEESSFRGNIQQAHPESHQSGSPPHIVSVLAPDTLVRPPTGFYLFEVQATVEDPDSTEDVDSVWFYSRNSPNPDYRFLLSYHDSTEVWSDTFQINSQANIGTYPFVFYARDREGNLSDSVVHIVVVIAPTSVEPFKTGGAERFKLFQNSPNPFNPATTISFSVPGKSLVSLKVFDALGREVSILLAEELPSGTYTRHWNAAGLASGMYFYRLQAGSFTETRKLILLR